MKSHLLLLVTLLATLATSTSITEEIAGLPMKLYHFIDDHTVSKAEAKEIAHRHRFQKNDSAKRLQAVNSHHRAKATREKLGLPILGGPAEKYEN